MPRPSGSGSTSDDGLIGGSTGDLLNPPAQATGPSPSGGQSTAPGPDITIPPLLPGILPGLGLDGGDG